MAKAGCEPVAMADLDHVSIAALPARNGHLAGRCRPYRFAKITAQVDAGMDCETAQDRVHSLAEWRGHVGFAVDRIANRDCDQRSAVAVKFRASHIHAIQLTFKRTGT